VCGNIPAALYKNSVSLERDVSRGRLVLFYFCVIYAIHARAYHLTERGYEVSLDALTKISNGIHEVSRAFSERTYIEIDARKIRARH
jgi:hypothetical protein